MLWTAKMSPPPHTFILVRFTCLFWCLTTGTVIRLSTTPLCWLLSHSFDTFLCHLTPPSFLSFILLFFFCFMYRAHKWGLPAFPHNGAHTSDPFIYTCIYLSSHTNSTLLSLQRGLRSADVRILRQLVAVHEGIEAMRWLMEERDNLASRDSSLTGSLSSLVTVEEHGPSMSPYRYSTVFSLAAVQEPAFIFIQTNIRLHVGKLHQRK